MFSTAMNLPRISFGTSSCVQGNSPVSPVARHRAKAITQADTQAKAAPVPYSARNTGASSIRATMNLRAVHTRKKVRR